MTEDNLKMSNFVTQNPNEKKKTPFLYTEVLNGTETHPRHITFYTFFKPRCTVLGPKTWIDRLCRAKRSLLPLHAIAFHKRPTDYFKRHQTPKYLLHGLSKLVFKLIAPPSQTNGGQPA